MKSSLGKWKNREVKCNNWHLKDSHFMPLPSLAERLDLTRDNPVLLSYKLPKNCCIVTYDPAEIDSLQKDLKLIESETINYLATEDRKTEAEETALSHIETMIVERSSSFRSFFWQNYMIKVSLQKQREEHVLDKILYSHQIERAIHVSSYLNKVSDKNGMIQFLNESFGCYLKDENRPYGYLIRQIPQTVLNGTSSLVSIVSYVSNDDDGNSSLLLKHLAGKNNAEKIHHLKKISESIISAYLKAYWDYGVCLELHQQNTLLEVDNDDNLTGRVFYRDMDGARVDLKKVSSLGYEFDNRFSGEESEYIFQFQKIDGLKNKIHPTLKNSLVWNGLMIYAFRLFVIDSSIYLLDYFSKAHLPDDFNLQEYAHQFVNQEIMRKSPETFFLYSV